MRNHVVRIFTGTSNPALAEKVVKELGMELVDTTVERFPDSEIRVKINQDVRGSDAYVIQSTCPPVNDNLMELLILIDCLRRTSAARITAVIPYFGYARQDRKDEGRVPITAKLVANMLTTAGAHRIMTIQLHAEQIQGFFDIPVDHLYGSKVFIDYLKTLDLKDPIVLAPDVGSSKRALAYAKRIGDDVDIAIVEKRRESADTVRAANIIGEVEGRDVVIPDDMISTGGSIVEATRLAKKLGAKKIYIAATHGVLVGPAKERLSKAPVEKVLVTDTIPIGEEKRFDTLKVLSVAPLLAKAITHVHENRSVSILIN
jgi:ribose-phosphate pyrophosphokinase